MSERSSTPASAWLRRDLPLLGCGRSHLVQDLQGDGNLPNIVEERLHPEPDHQLRIEAVRFGQAAGVVSDALAMTLRITVPSIDRRTPVLDHLEEYRFEPLPAAGELGDLTPGLKLLEESVRFDQVTQRLLVLAPTLIDRPQLRRRFRPRTRSSRSRPIS